MNNKCGTILYVGGFEMPDKNAAAHRVMNNAKAFRNIGYDVIFCGIDHDITNTSEKPIAMEDFISWPTKYPNGVREWCRWMLDFSHIRRVINSCSDIKCVCAYNMHAVPLARLMRYCKIHHIKLIADVTEWYGNYFSFHPIGMIKWLDVNIVMRYLLKRTDAMIVISTYLEKYYKKYVEQIAVVPPLVDVRENKWHQSVESHNNFIEFVYSGTPATDKDKIGLIVNCFSKLKVSEGYVFNVLGITRQDFLQIYPEQEKQLLSLGDKIIFRGRVSHYESIAMLLQADYSIFIREKTRKNMAGFPTKFVECCTSGVGIVANNVSDIKKFFPEDNKSILLEDISEDNIIAALEMILNNKKNIILNEREKREHRELFDYRKWQDVIESIVR